MLTLEFTAEEALQLRSIAIGAHREAREAMRAAVDAQEQDFWAGEIIAARALYHRLQAAMGRVSLA